MGNAKKGFEEGTPNWMPGMLSFVFGIALALGITLLALLLCSAAISAQLLSRGAMEYAPCASALVGSIAGAALCSGNKGRMAPAWGLGLGAALFLLLLLSGLVLYENAPVSELFVRMLLACLCGGGLIGLLNRGNRRKWGKTGKRVRGRGKGT